MGKDRLLGIALFELLAGNIQSQEALLVAHSTPVPGVDHSLVHELTKAIAMLVIDPHASTSPLYQTAQASHCPIDTCQPGRRFHFPALPRAARLERRLGRHGSGRI